MNTQFVINKTSHNDSQSLHCVVFRFSRRLYVEYTKRIPELSGYERIVDVTACSVSLT